jgi:hypothetical protein
MQATAFAAALSDLQAFHSELVNFLSLRVNICFNFYFSYLGEVKK